MSKRPQRFEDGETVRVEGHAGDEQGEVHGLRGRVTGDQRSCQNKGPDGIHRTNIITEDGTMVGVPTKALRRAK